MFSDRRRLGGLGRLGQGALWALGAMLLASSCGLRIGEPANEKTAAKLGSTACLDGASRTLSEYFHGNSTDEQISALYSCAERSLKLFQEKTAGAVPGVYTKYELRKFLERYFLNDFHISDGFLNEVMELKRTLLGGNVDTLTIDELHAARQLMQVLKEQSLALRPFLPLRPSTVAQQSREKMEESIAAFRTAATELGEVLQERASPYAFVSLDRLLYEIENFLSDEDYQKDVAELRRNLPIFRQLKKILVSPDDQQMAGTDWRVLLSTGADLYSFFLRYSWTVANEKSLYYGRGREEIMEIASDGYHLINQIIDRNPNEMISYPDLDRLVDLIEPKMFEFGEYKICPQHVKNFLRPLLRKLLSPDHTEVSRNLFVEGELRSPTLSIDPASALSRADAKAGGQEPVPPGDATDGSRDDGGSESCASEDTPPQDVKDGLKKDHIRKIWDYVIFWSEGQRFLEKTFEWLADHRDVSDPLEEIYAPEDLLRPSIKEVFGVPNEELLSRVTREASRNLQNVIRTQKVMYPKGETRMIFDGHIGERRHSFDELSFVSAIRLGAQMALSGYADAVGRLYKGSEGSTVEELEAFYQDTRQLGIDLKLYDPTVATAASRRFMEANLFTYSANGDGFMNLNETSDLISFLFSAKGLSHDMHALVTDECRKESPGNIGGPDIYGRPLVDASCYRRMFYDRHVREAMDHMPRLLKYFTSLPKKTDTNRSEVEIAKVKVSQDMFRCFLEQVARPTGASEQYIDSGDTDQIAALMHYLEGLFVRFDVDDSGTLNLKEAELAFPVLEKTLRDAAKSLGVNGLKSSEDYFAVLTYLLKYGEVPSVADYVWWRYVRGAFGWWNFEADRGRIMQIMALVTGKSMDSCLGVSFKGQAAAPKDPNHRADPAPVPARPVRTER